ncbi:MAG: methyl-accepting chemotaxis protein [Methylophilaceae bacterium]
MKWFSSLSIRWKLQIYFFAVTIVTTIYNRVLAAHELQKMVDIAKASGVSETVIQQLADNRSHYILSSVWESGLEFLVQFFVIAFVASLFVKPIQRLCHSLQQVEKGDLTHHIETTSHDEIGVLEKIFNSVLERFNTVLGQVEDNSQHMNQSAIQVTTISHEISRVGHQQEERSIEVTVAMMELHMLSERVQKQAGKATEYSKQVESLAQEGIASVNVNVGAMDDTMSEVNHASQQIQELEQSAQKIHDIVSTILEISAQTNLLALNAAIEAARAGEYGRGFAVVADEVRKLAVRTSNSAGEVGGIINQLSDKVLQVTKAMSVVVDKVVTTQTDTSKTAQTIQQMANNSVETAQANMAIADACQEQLNNFQQLQTTLQMLFSTLKENSTKVEATATIGENLRGISGKLNDLMADFKFAHYAASNALQDERRTVPRTDKSLMLELRQGPELRKAITRDFSMTGMSFGVSQRLNKDAPIEVTFHMPCDDVDQYGKQPPVQIKARVAWQREEGGKQLCALEFVDISPAARQQVKECFAYFNQSAEFSK